MKFHLHIEHLRENEGKVDFKIFKTDS